jgi:hypothetical protein
MAGDYPSTDFAITEDGAVRRVVHGPSGLTIMTTRLSRDPVAVRLAYAIEVEGDPAQVGARLVEFGALRHVHPLVSARLSTILHPLGAAALAFFGAPAVLAFAFFHGAATAFSRSPAEPCRSRSSGRSATASAPASSRRHRASRKPWGHFSSALLLDRMGVGSIAVSTALGLAAFAALPFLKPHAEPVSAAA